MKVAFIVPSLKSKGPTFQLLNLAREFIELGIPIELYVLSASKDDLSNSFEDLGVSINFFEGGSIGRIILAKRAVDASTSNIFHSHGILGDLVNVVSKHHRTKKFSTVRNIPYIDYPSLWGAFRGHIIAFVHIVILRRLNAIACSEWMLPKLQLLKPTGAVRNATQERFNYSFRKLKSVANHISFYCVGSINKRKNVLGAIALLDRNFSDYSVDVFGSGHLINLSENLSVKLAGQTEKKFIFSQGKIFISMSLSEGFPNAVIEALNSGSPCILSDIPPHNEIKEIYGDAVYIYDNDDNLIKFTLKYAHKLSAEPESQAKLAVMHQSFNTTKNMANEYIKQYTRG